MNILAIDIGSYSIKFYEVKSERRNFVLQEKHEIVLDEIRAHYPNIQSTTELQKEVVANFLQKIAHETKVIFQLPNEFVTTRYFELPVNSRAKAEQMIPFQLDDNLPYPVNHAHHASIFFKKSNSFSVITNIIQESEFKNFYHFFDLKNSLPHVVTTEISLYQAMTEYLKINENALIIDLGHKTTKMYVTMNRQIVSNHLSYIAGAHFNEVIARSYQLSLENAQIHKQENGFFLNLSMYDEVTPEQKEFGLIMKQAISPLIQDIRRAEIGHRVKFGANIDKIYLTGGTSLFNNIDGFLAEQTGLPVSKLPTLNDIKNDFSGASINLNIAKMMILAHKNKQPLLNFLIGKYQTQANTFISLHSTVFIAVRAGFIALLIILGLLSEKYYFLKREETQINKKVANVLKSPLLNLTKPQQNSFKNAPQKLLSNIKKKNQIIKQEVSTILAAQKINAIKPLATLSQVLGKNPDVNLIEFENDSIESKALFSSENIGSLKVLEETLRKTTLNNLTIDYTEGQKTLSIRFSE